MRVIPKKTSRVTEAIKSHIAENFKAYIIVSLIILIGIVLGVMLVNNISEDQTQNLQTYLHSFTEALKEGKNVNSGELLKKSLGNNLLLVFLMWFVGSTVIGIPVVLGIVAFRGFCLGYTISSLIKIWGTGKGMLFFATSMLLQNLITIPCIISLAVSGIKLYKSIMKDKRRENIKIEIIRHTIFSLVMLAILAISSIIETYLSTNLLMLCKSYF